MSSPIHAITQDGVQLTLHNGQVTSLTLDGQELATRAASGFFVRDVMADSATCHVTPQPDGAAETTFSGTCASLGLAVTATFTADARMIRVEGQLADLTGADRAVTLTFALPVDAIGWQWGDDIRRARPIDPATEREYQHVTAIAAGATGTQAQYPLAAIYNEQHGLALAVDMAMPALYRLSYDAEAGQLLLAYDFGLVPESRRFPGSAPFSFVIYRFAPAWGFRSAFHTLTTLFPDAFVVRAKKQGLWMPFIDISTVEGWQDFGFQFHEGASAATLPFTSAHGIDGFPYIEPMTWWMPMGPDMPRTLPAALAERDRLAAEAGDSRQHLLARVSYTSAMTGADGAPTVQFHDLPWCNGAVWSLNPNPYLSATPNEGTTLWNPEKRQQYFGEDVQPQMAGFYLDSLEGYVTADLNFCREHFRDTTVPLTFSTETRQPALQKGLAIFEFTRYIAEDLHAIGKLLFANGVPYAYPYLCPQLDLLGTEADWLPNGTYQPTEDTLLCLWRTMSGAKPYLLLMNTNFTAFTSDLVERYLQHSLFYGFYPSMFSANAAEHPYWANPTWYNRDRHLFRRYLPLITRVATAGWQPVTGVRSDNAHVWVERFGDWHAGGCYLTVLNTADTAQQVTLDMRELVRDADVQSVDLLSGDASTPENTLLCIALPPQGVAVWEVRLRTPDTGARGAYDA